MNSSVRIKTTQSFNDLLKTSSVEGEIAIDISTQELYIGHNGGWTQISQSLPINACFNCAMYLQGKCLNPLMQSPEGQSLEVPEDYTCDDWIDVNSIYIPSSIKITSNYNSYNSAWSTF